MEGSSATPAPSNIVKLNVGGTMYVTTMETLSSRGENFFTRLFSSSLSKTYVDGGVFIDRSGVVFEYVLRLLRGNPLSFSNDVPRNVLREELHFFCIPLEAHEEALLLDETPAHQLFSLAQQNNVVMKEAHFFVQNALPFILPLLRAAASSGRSHCVFFLRRSVLMDGRLNYHIPDAGFEYGSSVDFNTSLGIEGGGNGWSWVSREWEEKTSVRSSFQQRQNLEWIMSWAAGGIQKEKSVSDVFALLSHCVKRRENCQFDITTLADARNCSCYFATKTPRSKN